MSYDLTPMKAPRTAGLTLRLLTGLLENRASGALLAGKLLRDAGILMLRDTPATCPLAPMHPLQGLAPLPTSSAGGSSSIDLAAFDPAVLAASAGHRPAGGTGPETAADFRAAYLAGTATPAGVARSVLLWSAATDDMDPAMRIFLAQREDDVLAQAEASTARYRDGCSLGPLDGVPVAIKDELDVAGYGTTVGTRFLGAEPAHEDATVVARLRAAGAMLIGKTNMHEIGMGVTGLNPHHGACRNPHDPARATGGSSSGPAAAVAAGLCPIAIGADGGGSIRIPATLCGVVGLKATFGRVSEHGAAPLCWSLAHVGPIAATVLDTALAYAAIAGRCPRDPASQRQPAPSVDGLFDNDLRGIRIGLYTRWFEDAQPDVVARCHKTLDSLVRAGAEVVEVTIPDLSVLRAVHLVTIVSEMAAAHIQHFARHRKEYGLDVRLNMGLAGRLRSSDYVHAQRIRARLCEHFRLTLETVHAIATPAVSCTAPPIPADALQSGESNLVLADQIMRFAPAANVTGLPAIAVPAGYGDDGMPVGLQLLGRAWDEALLLRMGMVCEAAVERRVPRIHRRLLAAAGDAKPTA